MADRKQLAAMLEANPGDVFLQYALAMATASDGDVDEAIAQLAAINQTHPDYVGAYFQRARLLAKDGEADAAREIIEAGIAAAQRIGDAHNEAEMRGFLDLLT
ncbi:tetratricopeptide repeat protein [bacterium]|nr:tetratricopeptide repeat protein [bacterium]